MKKVLFIAMLFFSGTTVFSSPGHHPIKLTSSMIKYDKKNKNIGVECKVFFDDFAPAVSTTLLKSINESHLTKEDITRIENYFSEHFKISINGKALPWEIECYDIALRENILTLTFYKNSITLKEGDDLKIKNTMLFESFGDIQSNWMTFRLPPLLKNYSVETNTFQYEYSQTL